MRALDAIRPAGVGGEVKVFGLSEVPDRPAGEGDRQGRRPGRLRVLQQPQRARLASWSRNGAPAHEIEHQGRWKQGGGMVGRYTRGESAGSALRYL